MFTILRRAGIRPVVSHPLAAFDKANLHDILGSNRPLIRSGEAPAEAGLQTPWSAAAATDWICFSCVTVTS